MECPYCHYHEMAGALFCRRCGYPLWEEVARVEGEALGRETATRAAREPRRTARDRVRLRLPDGHVIALEGSGPWIVGRATTNFEPDLDAQSLGARHVSRKHARLEWRHGGLYLIDLDSTNGTWVNGKRLYPHEPKRLRDGDWVRWADLEVQVLLPTPGREPEATAQEDSVS